MRFWHVGFVDFKGENLKFEDWAVLEAEIALIKKAWKTASVRLDKENFCFVIGYSNLDLTRSCVESVQKALKRHDFITLL